MKTSDQTQTTKMHGDDGMEDVLSKSFTKVKDLLKKRQMRKAEKVLDERTCFGAVDGATIRVRITRLGTRASPADDVPTTRPTHSSPTLPSPHSIIITLQFSSRFLTTRMLSLRNCTS